MRLELFAHGKTSMLGHAGSHSSLLNDDPASLHTSLNEMMHATIS